MRWDRPVEGSFRIKRKFLLIPRKIGNQWRWLEKAEWAEEYKCVATFDCGTMMPDWCWIYKEWVN